MTVAEAFDLFVLRTRANVGLIWQKATSLGS